MFTKSVLLCSAFILLNLAVSAQEPCNKSLNEAPPLFGLRLGMSFAEAQAVLGRGIKLPRKKSGEGSFFQNFIDQPAPGNLTGVRALFLRLFNHRIYQIEIFYEDGGQSVKLEDFINRLSATLPLPASAWTFEKGQAIMDCGSFTARADTILNPHVELTDNAASAEFQKKREDGRKKKKKSG